MKRWIFLLLVLSCACAASAEKHRISIAPNTAIRKIADFGPGCRIKIAVPAAAKFRIYRETEAAQGGGNLHINGLTAPSEDWFFDLTCHQASEFRVNQGWAVSAGQGIWQLNDSESTRQLLPLGALRFYELKARNSRGWAVTFDDIWGDEGLRQRNFSYCLVRNTKAICGEVIKTGYLESFRRHWYADLTPDILSLLRSIEFLDDASSSAAPPLKKR